MAPLALRTCPIGVCNCNCNTGPTACCARACPFSFSFPQETSFQDAVDIAGFSNTGLSMLTVFQCITLTGWSFAFYRTTDNTNPTAAIYYVLLVAVGAYVLVG